MKPKISTNKTIGNQSSEQGFSLVETVIALTTLGICLAYAMPLFLYAKINNSKSQIRTGALIVAQRTFDNIRSRSIAGLPQTDGTANDPDATNVNPERKPVNVSSPTPQEELLTKAMGRQYQTKITYCENITTVPTICSSQYRQFKVEVSFNGSKVYDLQGTYTQFD